MHATTAYSHSSVALVKYCFLSFLSWLLLLLLLPPPLSAQVLASEVVGPSLKG